MTSFQKKIPDSILLLLGPAGEKVAGYEQTIDGIIYKTNGVWWEIVSEIDEVPNVILSDIGPASGYVGEKILSDKGGISIKSNGIVWQLSGLPKGAIVLNSSISGSDSGWLPASSFPERFGVLLNGTAAVISITGSNDGVIADAYSSTITMDTAGTTLITPPMCFNCQYIKFTITSLDASSSIQLARGL